MPPTTAQPQPNLELQPETTLAIILAHIFVMYGQDKHAACVNSARLQSGTKSTAGSHAETHVCTHIRRSLSGRPIFVLQGHQAATHCVAQKRPRLPMVSAYPSQHNTPTPPQGQIVGCQGSGGRHWVAFSSATRQQFIDCWPSLARSGVFWQCWWLTGCTCGSWVGQAASREVDSSSCPASLDGFSVVLNGCAYRVLECPKMALLALYFAQAGVTTAKPRVQPRPAIWGPHVA